MTGTLQPKPIPERDFRRLHHAVIEDPARIRVLLDRLCVEDVVLRSGMNRRLVRETARIVRVSERDLLLHAKRFETRRRTQVFLNFELDGTRYFFAAPRLGDPQRGYLRVGIPPAVYRIERRDRVRHAPDSNAGDSPRVLGHASAVRLRCDLGIRNP